MSEWLSCPYCKTEFTYDDIHNEYSLNHVNWLTWFSMIRPSCNTEFKVEVIIPLPKFKIHRKDK